MSHSLSHLSLVRLKPREYIRVHEVTLVRVPAINDFLDYLHCISAATKLLQLCVPTGSENCASKVVSSTLLKRRGGGGGGGGD